ncbi:hypothetical protein [Pseudoflavonifractor phocaeensis]|uniref:hypothetical protein n=1 Tax=Pseudoflavonifractor phocaeensis TaxID=1870988 RepID=UPI001F454596|nr:hypothetical protein [Pseudoflavonifractor phocaeensis]MCF2596211.1 hypothetical protein [Pseudoflavonifractor phocaeensis]
MLGGSEFRLRQGFACGKTLVTRHSAQPPEGGIYSVAMLQVVADFISFATTFYFKKSSLIHSVAPPFPIEPAAQPLAALPPYGCSVPLAGASPGFGLILGAGLTTTSIKKP